MKPELPATTEMTCTVEKFNSSEATVSRHFFLKEEDGAITAENMSGFSSVE
jgi:hypothetical protein